MHSCSSVQWQASPDFYYGVWIWYAIIWSLLSYLSLPHKLSRSICFFVLSWTQHLVLTFIYSVDGWVSMTTNGGGLTFPIKTVRMQLVLLSIVSLFLYIYNLSFLFLILLQLDFNENAFMELQAHQGLMDIQDLASVTSTLQGLTVIRVCFSSSFFLLVSHSQIILISFNFSFLLVWKVTVPVAGRQFVPLTYMTPTSNGLINNCWVSKYPLLFASYLRVTHSCYFYYPLLFFYPLLFCHPLIGGNIYAKCTVGTYNDVAFPTQNPADRTQITITRIANIGAATLNLEIIGLTDVMKIPVDFRTCLLFSTFTIISPSIYINSSYFDVASY